MPYTTKQRQAVLRCLEERSGDALTAQQLAEALHRSGIQVGLATVYRQLEKLETAGSVHRIPTEEGSFFQYCPHPVGRSCFVLRCQDCGRIVRLDCSRLEGLCRHLEADHHFTIDPHRTVLTGRCQSCAEKEETHGAQ